KLIETYFSK
nr:Chain C, MYELIN PROTEOLIPID PROTEIN [Homo sapiens]